MAVAAALGALVFRRRVRHAYFAILTQALAAAFVILLIGQQGYTGGTNGLTNVTQIFGLDLADPTNQRLLYFVTAAALGGVFLRLLLLDEPVAGMSKEERKRTGELLQAIARTRTLVVIEHDMDFVRRFSSGVTVLHEGKILCEGPVAEVQADPVVQEVYLGRAHHRAGAAVEVS